MPKAIPGEITAFWISKATLRRVRANIAGFCGDPTKVALGWPICRSQDTAANLVSPGAAGLFIEMLTAMRYK